MEQKTITTENDCPLQKDGDDTHLEFDSVDRVLEPVPQEHSRRDDEDDTNLDYTSVGDDDRHSLAYFNYGSKHSGCGKKP